MDKNNLKSKGFGSKEIASAAIKIALTSQREEEKMYQAEFLEQGIRTVAADFGGEFITSFTKIIERAVVASKEKMLFWITM